MAAERPRFGPYELVSRLGAGGMAETFVAIRRGPGAFEQKVCLKRILPAFEEDEEFVRLFLEEARIAATLRHANIVQVLDFGVAEGSHFMALELVDGLDLRVFLRTQRNKGEALTSGLVSYLAYEVSNALDYAHRADATGKVSGVVHRDISPSNVLLSTAGEVKLADFGIAKAMDKTHVTRSGNTKGKVPYMAPEYALAAEYDARSDLFSLGVTLYECLAGVRPFDGVNDLDTMRRVQDGEHTPLAQLLPSAPRALVDAIERLICPDKSARFANAAALQDALVDVAPPPTARRILGGLVRRGEATLVEEAERKSGEVAYANTVMATPNGTMVVDEEASESGHVVPASTSQETRTAAPSEHAATSMDPGAAEAHRVADQDTRMVEAEAKRAVDTATTHRPESPARGRGALIAGGAFVIVAAVGAALFAFGRDPVPEIPVVSGEPSNVTPTTTHTAIETSAPDPFPLGADAPEALPDDEEPDVADVDVDVEVEAPPEETPPSAMQVDTPSAGPTGLKVGVLPWGEVIIDGRSRGNAPVEVELRAGTHVVRVVGPSGLEEERRVRVTNGRIRELQIRLR